MPQRPARWTRAALALALIMLGAGPAMPPAAARAAAQPALREQVHAWRTAHRAAILQELRELAALPNVATDATAMARNAQQLLQMLGSRGLQPRLLECPGSPPAVLAQWTAPSARRTVVFYAHYDGQPVTPEDWTSSPWEPVLRDRALEEEGRVLPWPAQGQMPATDDGEQRVYARSVSDDKGPIVALLAALDALRAQGIAPSVNVKFFFEGEEEQGSPHARQLLELHRNALAADAWIFCDGPVDPTRRQQVVFGVRGVLGAELTVYGPARPLHSGHYGNWAPNPIALLAELLAGLRSSEGRILIPGFQDDVRAPTAAELAAIVQLPDAESGLRRELALGRTENAGTRLMQALLSPAINFRGVQAGAVGERAANQIPSEARASIDFRLVPDQTPEGVRQRVEAHLVKMGFEVVPQAPDPEFLRSHSKVVRVQWEAGYAAYRCAMDAAVSRAVVQVIEHTQGVPVLQIPSLGGSLPLSVFHEILQVPLITVPIVNHDNRQHAADENLRLQNLWDGIEIYAALFAELGARWK